MDHELKQRLIGAIVVTALAAIFLPMLFDDPIDNSGQQVSELTIPKAPENLAQNVEKKLPEDFGRALTAPDQETAANPNSSTAATEEPDQTAQTESPVEDELIVTEDNEEAATPSHSVKAKAGPETLDTREVLEADKSDDIEPMPVKSKSVAEPKVSNGVSEAKIKKKPKNTETDSHKTVSKVENSVADTTTHKTKTATAKTGGLSRWSIQAGSFSKKENAVALLEKLQKQGFPVTLQSKGDIYRLKIGPELDKQRAADMKKRLDKQNIQSLMITE
ncbi:Sporulation-like protein [Crenothrix polyspora]|uniref:Sporulation-like protein n=1 Tax=Crenothrix polyspora TaxID=360316 RepID=A0A1R4HIA8_9GAMM|nr:SPOR domain-containing protein [Crenothrix polyspora]SJM95929.1 Sporulation-like protein [Crenothrix polyspora]